MQGNIQTLTAAMLLLAQIVLVASDGERTVDADLFDIHNARGKSIINTYNIPTPVQLTVESSKQHFITKIEMQAFNTGGHWIATLTMADNTVYKEKVIVADLTEHGERLQPHMSKHEQFYVANPSIVQSPHEKNQAAGLTLYRLLQCVSPHGIKGVYGECFIYAYRIVRFARGQCECGKCIDGANPLQQMKDLIEVDPNISQTFKEQIKKY